MSDRAFVLRNLRIALRRNRGFVFLVSLGSALALLCVGIVAQAAQSAGSGLLESAALRTIEISAAHGPIDDVELTRDRLDDIATMPEVAAVDPWLQAGFNTADDSFAAVFWATPRIGYVQPPIVASIRDEVFPLADDEVVLPRHYAEAELSDLLGTRLNIQYTERTGPNTGQGAEAKLRVVGLYDESTFTVDGPAAAYVSLDTVLVLAAAAQGVSPGQFGLQVPYPKAMVEVHESAQVPIVEQRLRDAGFAATSIQSTLTALPQAMSMLSFLGGMAAVIVGLYSLGAGATIGGGMVRNRTREIGLLKALGFSRPRVGRVFMAELLGLGIVAGIGGVVAGNLVGLAIGQLVRGSSLLGAAMADTVVLPDWRWSIALLVLPALAMATGGYFPARQAASLAPDEALRDL
jgi:putative ABC transport system permease protein